jgi:hypothetical protein
VVYRRAAPLLVLALAAAACTAGPADTVTPSKPQSRPSIAIPVDEGDTRVPIVRAGSSLTAIDGAGGNDVWAVGETHGRNWHSRSLVAHWDGASWNLVAVPDAGRLVGVSVIETDDAWALGRRGLLHWDGARWSMKTLPRGSYASLSASGPDDVWIAGTRPGPMVGANSRGLSTVVAHYDDTDWTVMHPPNPGTRDNYLNGIVARSATDAWAGGYSVDLGKRAPEAESLTMRWNGEKWSVVRSPNPSPSLDVIWAMGSDKAGGVWALGQYRASDHHLHALVLRWDGRSWAAARLHGSSTWSAQAVGGMSSGPVWVVGGPATSSFAIARCVDTTCDTTVSPTELDRSAWSVFAASADDAWVAGVAWGDRSTPLVEHWDGSEWSSAVFPNPPYAK